MKINQVVIASILAVFGACKHQTKQPIEQAKVGFELSPRLQQEITFSAAIKQKVQSTLELTGKVQAYEEKQVRVAPLVDGVIEKLSANLGDYVRRGQIMAVVRSSDVADLENQSVSSQSDLLTAQKNLQVQQDLFKSGLASDKDVTIAQNELLKAQGALRRANEVAGIYGLKNSLYTLKAPISGYVIEKNGLITDKMAFHEGDTGAFFTIADLSSVQVVANVYESDVAKVKLGQEARIRLLSYPDKVLLGKIDKINNVLDPQTRTMQVRISLSNQENLLKPEMFAQISIDYDGQDQMVAIPAGAVIFDKNKHFVVVYQSPKQISVREVQMTHTNQQNAFVYGGLKEGERVLTKNQLMVYTALNQ